METLIQDARYALRSLRRTPAFSLAALVTLTLGIGASAAIFTVVNATLLRPLPYPQPERLVQVMRRYATGTERSQTGLRYLFFRDHLASVSSLAAWRGPTGVNLSRGDRAAYVKATSVSKEFFDVFGVQPALGRSCSAEEDRDGGPAPRRRRVEPHPCTPSHSIESGGCASGIAEKSSPNQNPVSKLVATRRSHKGTRTRGTSGTWNLWNL